FEHVQLRMIANLRNVDEELAARVADAMNLDLPQASPIAAPVQDLPISPALRVVGNGKETLTGRSVGILIADGSSADEVAAVVVSVRAEGGHPVIVAPKIGGARLANGETKKADGQLEGTPSVLFDAVALVLSEDGARYLSSQAAALQFVKDA